MTQINLKIEADQLESAMNHAETIFRTFAPNDYFEATILNDMIASSYVVENLVYIAFRAFAIMAILIGVFGLYGLVSYMATSNQKTISIRKIFGASIGNVLMTFSSEYFVLMTVSFLLATPIAYFLCREWLNGFAYQIEIGVGYFILSFTISIIITAVTVGRKSLLLAKSNPIDALRYE
ncbi:MAG: FtsX-like permease family protein [Bacteroidota bacterium]